jgi:hypothetical protein
MAVACGAPQPVPTPQSAPTRQPAPTPTPTPQPQPPPTRQPTQSPPLPALPAVAAGCSGSALDLGKLARAGTCDAAIAGVALPASVTLAIEPATVTVPSGGDAPAHVVLTNTASDAVELVLDDGCDQLIHVLTELRDGSRKRVDVDERGCGTLGACAAKSIVIELPAGGTAQIPFAVEARKERSKWTQSTGCEVSRSGAVAPGTYALVAYLSLGILRGRVVVR